MFSYKNLLSFSLFIILMDVCFSSIVHSRKVGRSLNLNITENSNTKTKIDVQYE